MTATARPAAPRLCPSARCEPGATLLGVVGADGRVGYLTPAMVIDESFVARVRDHAAPPESRFRFAQPCVEGGCHHWTGDACGLIGRVRRALADVEEAPVAAMPPAAPRCSIRHACRWFAQDGLAACQACPLVITED